MTSKVVNKKKTKKKANISHVKVRSPYKALNEMEREMKSNFVNSIAKAMSKVMDKLEEA